MRKYRPKNLTSNDRSLEVYVSLELKEALANGEAAVHITNHKSDDFPIIILDKFKGKVKLEFRSGNSAFILEKCQNFVMNALLYPRSFVHVRRMSSCNYCSTTIMDASVVIGEDCMISHNVILQPSDQHDIIDLEKNEPINSKRSIILGKHVWIGRDAYIGSGVKIGDNSVIGAKSVVISEVPPNTVVAGNPGRVVKSGITWRRSFTKIGS